MASRMTRGVDGWIDGIRPKTTEAKRFGEYCTNTYSVSSEYHREMLSRWTCAFIWYNSGRNGFRAGTVTTPQAQ